MLFSQYRLFFFLPEDLPGERTVIRAAIDGIIGFKRIVREVLAKYQLRRFLVAYFFYIDGVNTVIGTASLFTEKTLGFNGQERIYLFLGTQISALLGA